MKRVVGIVSGFALILGMSAASTRTQPRASATAEPMVRFVEEVWNRGDYTVISQVVAPDANLHRSW